MILSYHINPDGIFVSNGKIQSKSPYVNFMLEQGCGNLNVCYHLDFNFANLCKLLKFTNSQLIQLYETSNLSTQGYRFHYVPKKFLAISHQDKFAVWSDASQYMERWDVKFGTPQEKCKEALLIANEVYKTLKNLGIEPTTLVSPISAFDKKYLDKLNLPTLDDIPLEASEYAYHCTRGPWIECFKRGYFKEAWDSDLVSAYPSMLSKLIDPRLGTWLKDDQWHDDAYYGYVRGMIKITADFSPIIYSRHHEHSHTPKGEWADYFSKQEIYYVNEYGKGEFELWDGWWYFPNKIVYPLKPVVMWLYEKKEKAKGLERKILKRIMSGIWGKLLSVDFGEVPGKRFFPVWGEEVECNTRLEVARFVEDNDLTDALVAITVDGILTDREIKIG